MKLNIHQEALRELDKAVVWYRKQSLFAPQRLQDEVVAVSKRILSKPQVFPLVTPGRRKALLRKFPYGVIFEWTPDAINIIAIAHAKRKTAYWRNRRMQE
jgi:plasmid stabilization system protein ParE